MTLQARTQPSKLPQEELDIYRLSDVSDGLSTSTDADDAVTRKARYLEGLGPRGSWISDTSAAQEVTSTTIQRTAFIITEIRRSYACISTKSYDPKNNKNQILL